MRHKECPAKVSLKVAETDKRKMVESLHASIAEARTTFASTSTSILSATESENVSSGLPPLEHIGDAHKDDEGWITFDKPFTYLYAGQSPYVSADFVQFPVALQNDGLLDVVLQEKVCRVQLRMRTSPS